ncbi:Glycosyltransferase involved in cell wall bisynthesis [Maribacter dokdonensis]|uniref:Glycosyltransferase involved in cell wall bisynthesis n=1 Tax=Maribacter dokdonensis TaxID=320912 RepID=A0ABY0UIG0_9FLAO|nr:glycosyltransferase family 4 protein [Maribacter dokdonensis]SDS73395.1 Glycosyltransferase involved in cell wall bisynthesis [Maribacter dokdonensis]
MKILHLNSYYIDNHLYAQLYSKLNSSIEQRVYIPIKLDREPENEVHLTQTELIFDKIITPIHKFNYFGKINKIFKSIISKDFINEIEFVHAHNLFTDGALAYKLNKKYNINYIVAVRTTDIELQYKFMWHRRPFIHRVLEAADSVIFISNIYRDKLFAMMPKSLVTKIEHKVKVIPNGIDDMWLEKLQKPSGKLSGPEVKLLYVGQIIERKNVLQLIEAVKRLNMGSEFQYSLTIVGPEGKSEPDYFKNFLEIIEPLNWVDYQGKIKPGEALMQAYRACDIFVMPSKYELFGLVYIEALSQGKPVLYSKGEGIDGFLTNYSAGKAVDPDNADAIAKGINEIVKNYKDYTDFDEIVLPFNWDTIASVYRKLYLKDE